jgi:beta-galactosidase
LKLLDLNNGWIFTKENKDFYTYESIKDGETVSLPHCFNAIDGQNGSGMFRGKCFYQKKIFIGAEYSNKFLFLEIGAAALTSEVYINGKKAGESNCGFALYRVFLSPFVKSGDNIVTIVVDNSPKKDVYPLLADFSFYGGLYRGINLLVVEALHFDLMDHGKDGIYVTQKETGKNIFELGITGDIINESTEEKKVRVEVTLSDEEQNIVLRRNINIAISKRSKFELTEKIDHPELWMGTENPYLYKMECRLYQDCKINDQRIVEIGFRTVKITPDHGMSLNGKPFKINGVSRHQDFWKVGNALNKEHMDLDMSIIKEIGANSVRLSHYQQNDYFYTLCDRNGILVWAEIPFISIPTTVDKENQNAKDQLDRLIKQAYNHCSIYCWGIQNEITMAVENEQIYKMVNDLAGVARKLDSGRYIAQANIHSVADNSKLNELTDFVGYNLYYGWYYGEMSDMGKRLDEFHKTKSNIPIMVTEYGVDANPQLHSSHPVRKDYTEEYQLLFLNHALKTILKRPFVLGGYIWAMFDFGSNNRQEGGEKGKNQKGLVTIDRKIKKDAYYLCKAYWSKEPFVRLAGSRYINRHEEINDIVILSNLKQVRLYLNDTLINESTDPHPLKKIFGVRLPLGKNKINVEASDKNGTTYRDEMTLNRVSEVDGNYILQPSEEKKHVTNWFEKFDLTRVQKITVRDGFYSIFDTIEEIYKSEQAKSVFKKYFGEAAENPQFQMMKGLMTIEGMSKHSRFQIPKELLSVINNDLNVISKNVK